MQRTPTGFVALASSIAFIAGLAVVLPGQADALEELSSEPAAVRPHAADGEGAASGSRARRWLGLLESARSLPFRPKSVWGPVRHRLDPKPAPGVVIQLKF